MSETVTQIPPTNPAVEAAPAVAAPAQRRKKKSNMLLVATDKDTAGLHYCAKAIVDVLRTVGQEGAQPGQFKPVGRDQIVAGLEALGLKTTQPGIRVLYYWKRSLLESGHIVKGSATA